MEKISRKGFLKIAAAAAMSGVTAAGLAACNAASSSSSAAGIYTPGTYTATAKGMSEITATVTFDANSITKSDHNIFLLFQLYLHLKKPLRVAGAASSYVRAASWRRSPAAQKGCCTSRCSSPSVYLMGMGDIRDSAS